MRVTALTPTIGKVKDDIDRVFDRFFAAPLFGEPMAPWYPLEKAEFGAFVPGSMWSGSRCPASTRRTWTST